MNGLTNLVNVYAPVDCDNPAILWNNLKNMVLSLSGCWLLMGDFNVVRYRRERFSNYGCDLSMKIFNSFIRDSKLFEFSLGRRKFTWISNDSIERERSVTTE